MSASTNEHIVSDRLRYLFNQFMEQALTTAEEIEFAELSLLRENDLAIQELEKEYWESLENWPAQKVELDRLVRAISTEFAPVRRINWRRMAIAASILFIVGLGGYFTFFKQDRLTKEKVVLLDRTDDVTAPSANRATITLADGSKMYLDSMSNGQLTMQGNVRLMKFGNGEIAYKATGEKVAAGMQYNTLTNPRGSKVIDVTLEDGSHVWLNAGSSIRYPIAFTGGERKVAIDGEAYFEVAHDASRPFFVTRGDVEVRVLGTHFNVNAYNDEPDMKVTLLEGSIRVTVKDSRANDQSFIIKPGQQAVVTNKIALKSNADLDEVMAWKEGKFSFGQKAGLASIMRQLARWYNIEVVYQDSIDVHFGGIISRQVNVSEVLHKIELTGSVHFKIVGNKVIVQK